MWIEIFRTGKWTSAQGNTKRYDTADLDSIVEKFDPANKPPVTVGHPESDRAPAFGWMKAIKREGEKLLGDFEFVPEFLELLKKGIYKNRSIGLRNGAINHVAFLGGYPPAVKGMEEIQFTVGDDGLDIYNFNEGENMENEELKKQLAATQAELEKVKADFAEKAAAEEKLQKQLEATAEAKAKAEEQARTAELNNFAESLVKDGKITPATKEKLVKVFLRVAGDADNFSEGGLVSEMKELFSSLPESETMKHDYACSGKAKEYEGEKSSKDYDGAMVDEDAEQIRQRAKELMKADSSLKYREAVKRATTEMKLVK